MFALPLLSALRHEWIDSLLALPTCVGLSRLPLVWRKAFYRLDAERMHLRVRATPGWA